MSVEASTGACAAPGPFSLRNRAASLSTCGYRIASTSSPSIRTGIARPPMVRPGYDRPRLNPNFRNPTPTATPTINPRIPRMALASPPASRSMALPGTTQEDQRADHRAHPEDEPHDRGRSGAGAELPEHQRRQKRPRQNAGNLGTQVLHQARPMESQRAGNITAEAGHANPHVAGLPSRCSVTARPPMIRPTRMMPTAEARNPLCFLVTIGSG